MWQMLNMQIWFQNKRAKQKRKQKIRAKTEKQVHIPKPPSFWPQNLSFNSSLQGMLAKLYIIRSQKHALELVKKLCIPLLSALVL